MKTLADEQGQLSNAHSPTASAEQDYDIDLKAILSFASHPLRYYYNTVLQVYLRDVEEELLSSEPFSIHGLDAYSLKSELTENWFLTAHSAVADHEVSDIDLIRRWQLADKLPRPPLDQFYVENLSTGLFRMFAHIAQNINGDACIHTLDLQVGKYRISGNLFTLGDSLVELSLSKKPGASFFSFWVKHVFWSWFAQLSNTLGVDLKNGCSRFVGPENEMLLPLLSAHQAEEYALQLCELFENATTEPYPFLPKTSYALLFESEAKAFTTFHGVQNIPAENLDPYWQRYCLLLNKLLPNTLLSNTQGNNRHEADWRRMPELEASVFFQQIQLVKDSFEFHTLSANMTDKALKLNDEGAN
jgi:exonuclease V gamma subunit